MANENPIVTMEINEGKEIKIELYPEIAPNTVNNFISLVNEGYYNGLTFHRVIKGFMIQGGCPKGDGTGDPGYSVVGEFKENGFNNDLAHSRGVISMARSAHPDSAGSQFFIMHNDSPHLDNQYTGFGKVISGIEVVDEITDLKVNRADKPSEDVVMTKVTVNTFGHNYDKPKKS